MAGPGPSIDDIMMRLAMAGITPQDIANIMCDPYLLGLAIRSISSGWTGTQPPLDSIPDPEPSQSDPNSAVAKAKAKFIRDRSLPPIRVQPLPKQDLLAIFCQNPDRILTPSGRTAFNTRQTIMGTAPKYSTKPLANLHMIHISDMLARKRHEGSYLLCRIISLPKRLVSLTVVVEDPRGDAAQLAIYRYPQVLDCSLSAADFLFPIGSIIAVREPYYRLPVHGHFPTIRVDSPSDLIFLDPQTNFVKNVTWTSGIIRRPAYFLQTAEEWKNMGNQHFQRKDWLCAAVAFSEGLKLSPNHDLLLLNRAAAYLELGWFNSAAFDADSFLTRYATHPTVHKAVFRAAKAYYMAERYEACANLVSRFGKGRFPQAEDYATRALQRIRERDHGEYNWDSIFDDCLRQRPIARPDIASFQGPVEIKTPSSAGQPRGLFVTEDVKAGALLVVSRPIVSYYPEEAPIKEYFASINLIKNSMDRRSDYILVDLLVQRMWDDLELTRRVGKMYAGDDFPPIWDDSPSTSSARPLPSHPRVPLTDIDIARAEAVCSMDGFTIDDMMSHTKRESRKTDDYPCALYELPSYCNHACLPSGSRVFFGDVMVIRAARDLKAGDEVTLMYYGLDARSSQDRQAEIQQKWGFTCTCLLCKADLVDPPEARRTRARLSTPSLMPDADIAKANAITVKSTYVDSPERRATGNFKPELHTSLKLLALANQRQLPHPELIITIIMDGLESIGLVITNREFGNGAPAGKFKIHPKQLVDVTRPPPLTHLCVPIIHEMVTAMYLIKQTQRARAWETVAVWLESLTTGGTERLFFKKHGPTT